MMKEMIQLNFTEEELIILQSIVAVCIMTHLENAEGLIRNTSTMNYFINEWPEASESLADKMTESVKVSMKLTEVK